MTTGDVGSREGREPHEDGEAEEDGVDAAVVPACPCVFYSTLLLLLVHVKLSYFARDAPWAACGAVGRASPCDAPKLRSIVG